jgi:hypothetical protein
MNSFRAVATFTQISPENLDKFQEVAKKMLIEIQKQDSIVRYDMFFTKDQSKCVVLEEYSSPEALIEHVTRNAALLDQLTQLGGKIEGNIFSIGQEGDALKEIKNNWDSNFHSFFAGKE